MLKKVLAAAAITAAATGATAAGATPAAASDSVGGDYSQNVNVIPHPCIDVDNIHVIAVTVPVANDQDAIQCDEISTGGKKYHEDKGPLSDLIDAGVKNH